MMYSYIEHLSPSEKKRINAKFILMCAIAYQSDRLPADFRLPFNLTLATVGESLAGFVHPHCGISELMPIEPEIDTRTEPHPVVGSANADLGPAYRCEFVPSGSKVTRRLVDICRSRVHRIVELVGDDERLSDLA